MEKNIENSTKRIDLLFSPPGKEGVYVLTTRQDALDRARDIPENWEEDLIEVLGKGWGVMDRGNRIEITKRGGQANEEEDQFLKKTIEEVTGLLFDKTSATEQ